MTSGVIDLGNAGLLPKVTANFVDNNAIQNTSQTRTDGTLTSRNNAKNANLYYGVGLDWTVFDGFRMFARLDQLRELQKLGEAELKLTIITKISDVHETYYLFDGFSQRRNEKIAKIDIENSKIAVERQSAALNSALTTAFQTYQTHISSRT